MMHKDIWGKPVFTDPNHGAFCDCNGLPIRLYIATKLYTRLLGKYPEKEVHLAAKLAIAAAEALVEEYNRCEHRTEKFYETLTPQDLHELKRGK